MSSGDHEELFVQGFRVLNAPPHGGQRGQGHPITGVPYPQYMLPASDAETNGSLVDFDQVLAMVRRQWLVVVFFWLSGLGLGVAYLLTALPYYTSTIDILIDKDRSRVIDQMTEMGGLQDEAETLSQIEVLKSDAIARKVVSRLALQDDPTFINGAPSIISFIIGGVRKLIDMGFALVVDSQLQGSDKPQASLADIESAISILRANTFVERLGRTYVLRLQYESASPTLSSKIASAFGAAYLEDQLQSRFDATTRAGEWLKERIGELRDQAYSADIAVQKFRRDNNLIAAGGRLVSEQQLSEISTQLVTAQAATAEALARVEQLEGLIKSGKTDAVVNDALVSSIITSLRTRYLNAAQLKAEIEAKLGPAHIQVVRLRNEMAELERLIFSELERISESYRSTYRVALSREESLRKSMDAVLGVNADANTTQVELRELEREAETFRELYTSFLKRHQETVQQQTFPISDARVISPAMVPGAASSPRTAITLALFGILGLASGAGFAAFREYRDRFFRTADQVRGQLQSEFLGFLPIVSKGDMVKGRTESENGPSLWHLNSLSTYARYHPFSAFSETLRNVKVAIDVALPQPGAKVIGIVSCLPSEGKSTVSANLANLIAQQGARVALIDGDLRNPGLTRTLAARPKLGLIETLLEKDELVDHLPLLRDHDGKLSVLPTVLSRRVSHTSDLLTSPRMGQVLDRLKKSGNDYIIVDLPPTSPVVDAKAFAHRLDALLFVVEWGRTSRMLVRTTLENTPAFREKCIGVILNKSDERKLKLYSAFGSDEYYSASRYKSYYQS